MKSMLTILLCVFACQIPDEKQSNQPNSRPNIVIIFADDMGIGDVSALNKNGKIKTPNIDSMVRNGLYFSDAHTSSSVCTPSRYSLLTGRYNWRSRLKKGVTYGFDPPVIEKNRMTLASLLKNKNYKTAIIGKWHLGLSWTWLRKNNYKKTKSYKLNYAKVGWDIDYSKDVSQGPLDYGFDYFFGISASLDMPPYIYLENNSIFEKPTVNKAFHRLGPASKNFEAIQTLPILTKKAVDYINDKAYQAKNGQPFFLYFALPAPHTPILPTKKWQGKSKLNKYGDFTMQVDHTVGQILNALKKNNLDKNTLILFTADNGCSPAAQYKPMLSKGHNPSYIYRGHKADLYEGGHRVPFIIQWPNKIKKAGERKDLLITTDLLATFADLTNQKLADNQGEDSISFLSLLNDKPQKHTRNHAIHHSTQGTFAIRQGNWKLLLAKDSGGWTKFGEKFRNIPLNKPQLKFPIQLYNLKNDIGEEINLAKKYPSIVTKLKKLLIKNVKRGRSTLGKKQMNTGPVTITSLYLNKDAQH